jgi:hypothetical protein
MPIFFFSDNNVMVIVSIYAMYYSTFKKYSPSIEQ